MAKRSKSPGDSYFSNHLVLIKSGIVFFVVLTGAMGYLLSANFTFFSWSHFLWTLVALTSFSASSFILNQIQDLDIDSKMDRTQIRPLVTGQISKFHAWGLFIAYFLLAVVACTFLNRYVFYAGLVTLILYNGFYSIWWKRYSAFGAVPGAIPGAMPVILGYVANDSNILKADIVYAFLIMFLWQMPHYWALAIKYKDDYKKADIPVLPVAKGVKIAEYYMAIYMFAYLAIVVGSPIFIKTGFFYLLFVLPMSLKILWEFIKYYNETDKRPITSFFLWTTLSILVFLITPLLDRIQLF